MTPETPSKTPISEISARLKSQDNRCTANPMFCAQIWKADKPGGAAGKWSTVMTTFTEAGCREYIENKAPKAKTRINVDSFSGCSEMEAIRETILKWHERDEELKKLIDRARWMEKSLEEEQKAKAVALGKTQLHKTAEKQALLARESAVKERDFAIEALRAIAEWGRNNKEGKLARQTLEKLDAESA